MDEISYEHLIEKVDEIILILSEQLPDNVNNPKKTKKLWDDINDNLEDRFKYMQLRDGKNGGGENV